MTGIRLNARRQRFSAGGRGNGSLNHKVATVGVLFIGTERGIHFLSIMLQNRFVRGISRSSELFTWISRLSVYWRILGWMKRFRESVLDGVSSFS